MTHGLICGCGARAIEDILRFGFRVDISKALDPMDPVDYVVIVGQLAEALSRSTRDTEVEILNRAMDALDVDWRSLTREQRQAVAAASREALSPAIREIIQPVTATLQVQGTGVMNGARESVREAAPATLQGQIDLSLTQRDQVVLDALVRAEGMYITDEYGRRSVEHGLTASQIVENGIANGLGTNEIAEELHARLGSEATLRRSEHYWRVIASNFANRARTYSALSTMDQAGIQNYIFEAVLDERTTDQCAYLHGKRFSVKSGLKQYEAVQVATQLGDPEAIRDIQPWVRVGRDEDGNKILYTQDREGNRQLVAQVDESRVGTRDEVGSFSRGMSVDELTNAGITMPPLHGLCRSTIVADV